MFTRVDRIQMAVPDRAAAARGWKELLGAEPDGDDAVACLGARRTRYRLGNGWVELLEPDGAGPIADAVAARGGHLFAGGMATPDVAAFVAHLRTQGVEAPEEGGQLFLDTAHTGDHGLRLVVSMDDGALPSVGAIDQFYEVTNLVENAAATVKEYVTRFGMEDKAFTPISSDEFGYEGTLTLLADDRLDRFEVITPTDSDKTMGRYFGKFGESLYMCFAESGDLDGIQERCAAAGAPFTRVPSVEQRPELADTVFLHPPALGGMMLGLSRRSVAWVWSGHPERVVPWREVAP
ncbi:MAG TPA: VOC family protein [Acidimicrobiia bacterium]|nr:VOC family protein [Acidimicrobiia bacterium]